MFGVSFMIFYIFLVGRRVRMLLGLLFGVDFGWILNGGLLNGFFLGNVQVSGGLWGMGWCLGMLFEVEVSQLVLNEASLFSRVFLWTNTLLSKTFTWH